jgi:hypothetical protein
MSDDLSTIIAEMGGKQTERQLREAKKAKRDARQEQIDADAEIAKRSAIEVLNERDRRDEAWLQTHLGSLTPHQYRTYIRERYGYDPGV